MKTIKINLIIISAFVFLIAGCREEIISPGNPFAEVNEPVKESIRNSYSFSINAEHLSLNHIDYPNITNFNTRVTFNISGYGSGFMDVTIFSNTEIIYQGQFGADVADEVKDISGFYPTKIRIRCENFTGKLKVQLSGN